MTAKVVDASVIAAILFDEPEIDQALQMLEGFDLVAPRLLIYEVINVASTKSRRRPEDAPKVERALAQFFALGVELYDVDMEAVYRAATRSGLTGYDAAYLWLGQQLNVDIATFDSQLLRAATR